MDKDYLQKYTRSWQDDLIEDLKDPESAYYYLEAVEHDFKEDGDLELLADAVMDVVEAQGSLEKVKKLGFTSLVDHMKDSVLQPVPQKTEKVLA
jgi:hypothetical protein